MAEFTDVVFNWAEDQKASFDVNSLPAAEDYILYSTLVTLMDAGGSDWPNIRNALNEGFETVDEARRALGLQFVTEGYSLEPRADRLVFSAAEGVVPASFRLLFASELTLRPSTTSVANVELAGARDSESESRPSADVVVNLKSIAALLQSGPLKTLFSQDFDSKDDVVDVMQQAGLVLPSSPFNYDSVYYTWVYNARSDGTSDVFIVADNTSYIDDESTDENVLSLLLTFMLPSQLGTGGGGTNTSSGLQVTIANNTDKRVYLSDIYTNIPANGRVTFVRSPSDLPSMYALDRLIKRGIVTATWEAIVP